MSDPTRPPCILFTSLSAKTALYQEVVRSAQAFYPGTKVVGCDSNEKCDAAQKVDHFIVFPKINELSDQRLLGLCEKYQVTHILPTRDGELHYWAKKKALLQDNQITVWVSDPGCIDVCNDKLAFFHDWADCALPPIKTYVQPLKEKAERWVVKARNDSGARTNKLGLSYDQACKYLDDSSGNDLIFQPYIQGREFSAEAWISKEGQCYGPLLRWRNKVVDGESHESTVFRNTDWESKVREVFLHKPGLFGHCLAQVIVEEDENLHLVEINPRLGGASPLALRAGLESIQWHFMEEAGKLADVPEQPRFHDRLSLSKSEKTVFIGMI